MRNMVLNFIPNFCPNCGAHLDFAGPGARQDFMSGCSHSCNCGMRFQYAQTSEILNAATGSGGDMEYYHQMERLHQVTGA